MSLRRAVFMLLFAGLAVVLMAPQSPSFVESVYSTSLYYWLVRPYSIFTGIFPFSVMEFILVSLCVFFVYKVVTVVPRIVKKPQQYIKTIPKYVGNIAIVLLGLYLAFNLLWGLNYSRLTFAEISGLPVENASVQELTELALHLTNQANELREHVAEDDRGVMRLNGHIRDMFNRAHWGYESAAEIYPELGGRYGRPKGVILSPYWSYTGIGGVYFPFTGEANVNTNLPHFLLPFTTTHEMAHQRGFAREDEANYIAYVTSIMHPDVDFQYSGTLQALSYTMSVLRRYDVAAWEEVRQYYSEGVARDFSAWQEYRARYAGSIREVSNRVNNTYLIANRQADGVHSYGRMVDLMLAQFRIEQTK